jgi:hypothetical protein
MIDPTNFDFDAVTKPANATLVKEVSKKTSLVPICLMIGGIALSVGVYLFLSKNEKKYGTENI